MANPPAHAEFVYGWKMDLESLNRDVRGAFTAVTSAADAMQREMDKRMAAGKGRERAVFRESKPRDVFDVSGKKIGAVQVEYRPVTAADLERANRQLQQQRERAFKEEEQATSYLISSNKKLRTEQARSADLERNWRIRWDEGLKKQQQLHERSAKSVEKQRQETFREEEQLATYLTNYNRKLRTDQTRTTAEERSWRDRWSRGLERQRTQREKTQSSLDKQRNAAYDEEAQLAVYLAKENKRLRTAHERNIENQKKQLDRGFAGGALGLAGIGIGLFGTAGFPLLNIGFAAMSGGWKMGVAAGAATAIGTLARSILELQDKALEAAKSLGFLGKEFKLATGREQTTMAFFGGLQSAISASYMEKREQNIRQNLGNLGVGTIQAQLFREQFSTAWNQLSTNIGSLLGRAFIDAETLNRAQKTTIPQLELAYKSMYNQLMKPPTDIISDPYAVWRKIQISALDPTKQEQMQVNREMLRLMKEEIELWKKFISDEARKGTAEKAERMYQGAAGVGGDSSLFVH